MAEEADLVHPERAVVVADSAAEVVEFPALLVEALVVVGSAAVDSAAVADRLPIRKLSQHYEREPLPARPTQAW